MFKKLMEGIAWVEKYLLAITMSVTLALTFANVVGRFVFNHSLAFADELVIALFVLVSLVPLDIKLDYFSFFLFLAIIASNTFL